MDTTVLVLFINHKPSQCGVYQFGKNTGTVLSLSKKVNFKYIECANIPEFVDIVKNHPETKGIIFNHHPVPMPWVNLALMKNYPNIKFFLIMHDFQMVIPGVPTIHPDPTVKETELDIPIGRLVVNTEPLPISVLPNTIGTFGFGFYHKGLPELVDIVNQQFNEVNIRMHIPFSTFGDADGRLAKETAQKCISKAKSGISVEINHEYMGEKELLYWLASNTINIFNYMEYPAMSNGLSSVIDWALAAHRPIGVSRCKMFRHILNAQPSICIEDKGIKDIIRDGIKPILPFIERWQPVNLIKDYERIVDERILQNTKSIS